MFNNGNSQQFDKESFKKAVKENVKVLFRKNIDEASSRQLFDILLKIQ